MTSREPNKEEELQKIWEQYFPRLQSVVHERLRSSPRIRIYSEDIALSAMRTYFRRLDTGELPRLTAQDELWKLLKTITIRKSNDHLKKHFAAKRGGGKVVGEGVDEGISIQKAKANDIAELEVDIMDWFRFALDSLIDTTDRDIILLRLEGASLSEIAESLGCSMRTVQRKLDSIEQRWQKLAN